MRTSKLRNLQKLDRLAWLLDASIRVPGTGWRIGLDGLIGLIPGIGDLSAGAISSYIVYQAYRMGAPTSVLARMTLNVLLETVVGAVPVVGDVFDFVFKANQRNVRLLRDYDTDPRPVRRRSALIVSLFIVGLVAVIAFTLWFAFNAFGWLLHTLNAA